MSAVIDTLERCKIYELQEVDEIKCYDPNGVSRSVWVGDLIYATDVVHFKITSGAGSDRNVNPCLIGLQNKVSGAWANWGTLDYHDPNLDLTPPATDTRIRWFSVSISGTETNSTLSFPGGQPPAKGTPDCTLERSYV